MLQVTVDRARGLGQPQRLDMALFFLGRTEQTHASVAESAAHLTEAVRLLEATRDRCVVGAIHLDLEIIAGGQRDLPAAVTHLLAGLEVSGNVRDDCLTMWPMASSPS